MTLHSQQGSVTADPRVDATPTGAVVGATRPKRIIFFAYYAFIFSLVFERLDLGIPNFALPSLLGMALVALTLMQLPVCFRFPPPAFWWFTGYVFLYVVSGVDLAIHGYDIRNMKSMIATRFVTLVQLLVLFWISYSLMRYRQFVTGFLAMFIASCLVVSMLLVTGLSAEIDVSGRSTVADANPNMLANMLALAMIAMVGLRYGPAPVNAKFRRLFWVGIILLAGGIVYSGSRGAVVGLMIGLSVYPLSRASFSSRIRLALAAVFALGFLAWASFEVDFMRTRWERTLQEGDVAGRFEIYQAAWEMFKEEPLFGWGPVRQLSELGSRLGLEWRNTHNIYLWILIEMGALGGIPFFVGLWLSWNAAWRARNTIHGLLPAAMMLFLLAINVKGNTIYDKIFWVLLAYSLASANYVALPVRRKIYFERSRPTSAGSTFSPYLPRRRGDVRVVDFSPTVAQAAEQRKPGRAQLYSF
jgi:O-antigen ligase